MSSWRLRLVALEVRIWRLNALPRLILPVAVFLKRFAAPLCVFSLGIIFGQLALSHWQLAFDSLLAASGFAIAVFVLLDFLVY